MMSLVQIWDRNIDYKYLYFESEQTIIHGMVKATYFWNVKSIFLASE